MDALLTYILHVNLLISLIYLGYYFLLKKLTFYNLNRGYFLMGGIYAFLFPLIDFKVFFTSKIEISPVFATSILSFHLQESSTELTLQNLIIYVIIIGVAIFILKFLLQCVSLTRIHINSKVDRWNQFYFRNVLFSITPFTFFRTIYLHKDQHQTLELNDIFKHEFIHVKGLHTIDVLLFETIMFCCWYNPFVWLLRRAVSQNLEFLTDQKVLDLGIDRQAYQFSLLKVSTEGSVVGLGNQFNFKNLKKRIIMMNQERSSKIKLSTYAVLIPILIFTGISFTSIQAENKINKVVVNLNETELSFLNNPMLGLKNSTSQFLANMMIQNAEDKMAKSRVVTTKLDTIITTEIDSAHEISSKPINRNVKFDGAKSNKKPLFVVDGEVMPKSFKLDKIDPNEIYSMEVIKGADATDRYGADGKDGVILLTLKSKVAKENIKVSPPDAPLYVFDGEVISGSEINKVSPDSIENISVLKGESATALYGEDGMNGVVLITSKNQINKSNNTKGEENFQLN